MNKKEEIKELFRIMFILIAIVFSGWGIFVESFCLMIIGLILILGVLISHNLNKESQDDN